MAVASEINKLWASSLFWKCGKFNLDFENEGKHREKILVFEITGCEVVALNCLYLEKNTCQRQSFC